MAGGARHYITNPQSRGQPAGQGTARCLPRLCLNDQAGDKNKTRESGYKHEVTSELEKLEKIVWIVWCCGEPIRGSPLQGPCRPANVGGDEKKKKSHSYRAGMRCFHRVVSGWKAREVTPAARSELITFRALQQAIVELDS